MISDEELKLIKEHCDELLNEDFCNDPNTGYFRYSGELINKLLNERKQLIAVAEACNGMTHTNKKLYEALKAWKEGE